MPRLRKGTRRDRVRRKGKPADTKSLAGPSFLFYWQKRRFLCYCNASGDVFVRRVARMREEPRKDFRTSFGKKAVLSKTAFCIIGGSKRLAVPLYSDIISPARTFTANSFSFVMAERRVTVVSVMERSRHFSRRVFIVFAAMGAQEPFSMNPILLFLYPLSTSASIKCFINGKISPL